MVATDTEDLLLPGLRRDQSRTCKPLWINISMYRCVFTNDKKRVLRNAYNVLLGEIWLDYDSKMVSFFVPLVNFSLIWRWHHCRWRAEKFDLCLAPLVIKQSGFLSLPRLLWHVVSVYIGHLREPVTLTPIAERLSLELSLSVFTT